MEIPADIAVVEEDSVTPEQKGEMLRLQIACFSDQVTAEEVEEDFDRPPVERVLAYRQGVKATLSTTSWDSGCFHAPSPMPTCGESGRKAMAE